MTTYYSIWTGAIVHWLVTDLDNEEGQAVLTLVIHTHIYYMSLKTSSLVFSLIDPQTMALIACSCIAFLHNPSSPNSNLGQHTHVSPLFSHNTQRPPFEDYYHVAVPSGTWTMLQFWIKTVQTDSFEHGCSTWWDHGWHCAGSWLEWLPAVHWGRQRGHKDGRPFEPGTSGLLTNSQVSYIYFSSVHFHILGLAMMIALLPILGTIAGKIQKV